MLRLRGLVHELLTPRRLIMAGLSIAIGIGLAFVIFVATARGVEGLSGGRLGGDWAPFWTAGLLARTDPQVLLEAEVQHRHMAEFLRGRFSPFAYPPALAFLFVPFSLLSFRAGYVVYVLLLTVAAIVAIRWILDLFGVSSPVWRTIGLLGGVTYAGTFRSFSGAQNATLTMLVLGGGHRLLQRDQFWQAGLVFGLLWYKPQFAIPVIGLLTVACYWRAALWALLPGVILWMANAAVFGIDWVATWSRGILQITDAGNRVFNTDASVSAVEYLRGRLDAPAGDLVGLALAAGLGLCFVVFAWGRRDPRVLLPLTCGALLLTAPHALTYEITLLVPVVAAGLSRRGPAGVTGAVIIYAAAWAMLLPVHPLVRAGYVLATLTWWQSSRPAEDPHVRLIPLTGRALRSARQPGVR